MIGTDQRGAAAASTPARVRDAAERLAGRVFRTPVVRSDDLDRLAGARLWLKAENLQRGGSFKMRGALLAVERLAGAGTRGVLAQSTGNHAIAVARAAQEHGVPATLVLSPDTAPSKLRQIRRAGAEIVLAGATLAERLAVVAELHAARGLDVVDPYEDPDVVAGQGSATVELLDQVRAAGGDVDAIVLPVGGGSAVAGGCLATDGQGVDVIAAEPAAVPALSEALRAGHPVTVPAHPTIADGLRPDRIGRLPFALARQRVTEVVTVAEADIAAALCAALTHSRLLIEPAAATALAVALRLGSSTGGRYRDIGVLLSGGNVEISLVTRLLAEYRHG